jgi:hypothetical protein
MAEQFDLQQLASSLTEGANLDREAAQHVSSAALDGAISLEQLCELWRRIRRYVVWVSEFPLVPGNIRQVLKQLIGILDRLCPSNG